MSELSPQRLREVLDSLRRGTVPRRSLDAFAVGLERFAATVDDELASIAAGGAGFKAVRGEYGSGKTFFARWLGERAKDHGFAVSEVQVSETETPLHRLETVYRRLIERLSTREKLDGALRSVVDGWFFTLEEDVLAEGRVAEGDAGGLLARTTELMEKRLGPVRERAPSFAAVLRAYRECVSRDDAAAAEALLAWLSGQPNVAAQAKRTAGVKGEIDHFGALSFLQGLLVVLRDSGRSGLVLILDEVETLQRVRGDVRDKGLNALRQLIDEVDAGRFPGLYLVITGTPAFYDGPRGAARLAPLAQRLATDFDTDGRFDNPRAPQIRLPGFDLDRLVEVGGKVRDLFARQARDAVRVRSVVSDDYLATLARALTGELGGRVGVAPRVFLKKLVSEVLDRVEQFADFDPTRDYARTVSEGELSDQELRARRASRPDDVGLDL